MLPLTTFEFFKPGYKDELQWISEYSQNWRQNGLHMLACTFFWDRSVSSNSFVFFFFLKSEMLIRLRTSTLYHLLLMALVTLHLYSFSKLGNYQKNETCITQVCEALGIQRQVRSDTCQDLTVLGDRKRGRDEVVQYNKKKKKNPGRALKVKA